MPNFFRSRPIKLALVILLSLFLFWSTGTTASSLALQNSETLTATTSSVEETVQSGEQSPTPETSLIAPSTSPTTDSSIITETPSSTATNNAPALLLKPLPAIFASGAYAPDELIIRFKTSTKETRIKECFHGLDIKIQSEIKELRARVIKINDGNLGDTYRHTLACAGVLYVEPNFLLQAADTIPNDPDWGLQYGLVNIRAPQGWDLTTGSATVTIAIIDTGVDISHPDLKSKLVPGYDFVNNDANPQDDNGHGTHVAGIAAASSNNNIGIAGTSWGARIMPIKVLNNKATGTYANTALGVIWAVDHGAQVINLSLGGTDPSSVLADAINYAHSQGTVVVAAAGNTGDNFVLYPARYPNVIAVAKTNSTNNWDGSNYGPEIDLAAPGTAIYSTVIGGYDYKSGSSLSTAFVSGLAAILKGVSGNTSPDTIETQMESTALDIEFAGWDEYTGAGLIQMDMAIQLAKQNSTPPNEQEASQASGGYIPRQVASTNTPIPIWTFSSTPSTSTATVTFTIEADYVVDKTETATNTPTQVENEVEAQGRSGGMNYFLPCTGIFLILLGLILIWFFRGKDKLEE